MPTANGRNRHTADQTTTVRESSRPSGEVTTLTDATFQDAVRGPLPVLVDFWAVWCGPCRMVAPVVEQIGKGVCRACVVGKLNVDENPQTGAPVQRDEHSHAADLSEWACGGPDRRRTTGARDPSAVGAASVGS